MTMCLYHSSRCDIVVTRCGGDLNVMTMCLYHSSRLSWFELGSPLAQLETSFGYFSGHREAIKSVLINNWSWRRWYRGNTMWWGLECYDNAFVSFKYVCIDLGGAVLWFRGPRGRPGGPGGRPGGPRGHVLFVLININGRDKWIKMAQRRKKICAQGGMATTSLHDIMRSRRDWNNIWRHIIMVEATHSIATDHEGIL